MRPLAPRNKPSFALFCPLLLLLLLRHHPYGSTIIQFGELSHSSSASLLLRLGCAIRGDPDVLTNHWQFFSAFSLSPADACHDKKKLHALSSQKWVSSSPFTCTVHSLHFGRRPRSHASGPTKLLSRCTHWTAIRLSREGRCLLDGLAATFIYNTQFGHRRNSPARRKPLVTTTFTSQVTNTNSPAFICCSLSPCHCRRAAHPRAGSGDNLFQISDVIKTLATSSHS